MVIVYFAGPKPNKPHFNPDLPNTPKITDLVDFVSKQELNHKIKPGNEAEIVWADSNHRQTEYAIVYLHGFSASKEDGNPVHHYLAKALKANMYLARLADHGIDTIAPMQYLLSLIHI